MWEDGNYANRYDTAYIWAKEFTDENNCNSWRTEVDFGKVHLVMPVDMP